MKKNKLSPAQIRALTNIMRGQPSNHGLYGRSAYGGHAGTIASLYRLGLIISNEEITEAGLEALQNNGVKIQNTEKESNRLQNIPEP